MKTIQIADDLAIEVHSSGDRQMVKLRSLSQEQDKGISRGEVVIWPDDVYPLVEGLIEAMGEVMGENGSKVPHYIIRHLSSDRLKRLVNQVWERLPAHDRHTLGELLFEISDDIEGNEHHLGSAQPINVDSFVAGCAAQVAEDLDRSVSLTRTKEIESDDAAMHVIAHEFAHIVLRHSEMATVVSSLLGFEPEAIYTDDDREALREWIEDHANLQAWLWGFQDEFRAFLDAYPKARRPRWYVELD